MATTEDIQSQSTLAITATDTAKEAIIIAIAGGVRFQTVDEALAWSETAEAAKHLFGTHPQATKNLFQLREQLKQEKSAQSALGRLNRLWLNGTVQTALWKAFVREDIRKALVAELKEASRTRTEARNAVLERVIAELDVKEAEETEKEQLIAEIKPLIEDSYFMGVIVGWSNLRPDSQRAIDKILAGKGKSVHIGQLRGVAKHLTNIHRSSSGSDGGRRGKGKDPRKAEKSARDRAIRARMQQPKGQEPPKHGKKK